MNSEPTRRRRFTRRKRPLRSEHGKTKPDARGELRRGLETVDLGFPQSKGTPRRFDPALGFGCVPKIVLIAPNRFCGEDFAGSTVTQAG
jgi:hypothetical protein